MGLGVSAYGKALEDFEATQAELVLMGIDQALASALALGAATTLVTWDKDLARAAIAGGCGVAPSL